LPSVVSRTMWRPAESIGKLLINSPWGQDPPSGRSRPRRGLRHSSAGDRELRHQCALLEVDHDIASPPGRFPATTLELTGVGRMTDFESSSAAAPVAGSNGSGWRQLVGYRCPPCEGTSRVLHCAWASILSICAASRSQRSARSRCASLRSGSATASAALKHSSARARNLLPVIVGTAEQERGQAVHLMHRSTDRTLGLPFKRSTQLAPG
jgi:hypothetical protein